MDTVVLDVDGTLLDSNFHHALAWSRAFQRHDLTVPLWRIRDAIGMGGDRLVAAVAGEEVERERGDDVRDAWEKEYDALIGETRLLPGARELLDALKERGVDVALASSSIPEHAARAFELLDAEQRTDAATTSEDAEESKPDPQLIEAALDRVGGGAACVVGDSVWDVEAAKAAGLPAYGLLCGGTSAATLLEAGAVAVYTDPADLLEHLDDWLQR